MTMIPCLGHFPLHPRARLGLACILTPAVRCAALGAHAHRMPIGACNPMLRRTRISMSSGPARDRRKPLVPRLVVLHRHQQVRPEAPERERASHVQWLRPHFGPALAHSRAVYHPPHAVCCVLLGAQSYRVPIGACDPVLCPIWGFRPSAFFDGLYYSYRTCGEVDQFADWSSDAVRAPLNLCTRVRTTPSFLLSSQWPSPNGQNHTHTHTFVPPPHRRNFFDWVNASGAASDVGRGGAWPAGWWPPGVPGRALLLGAA